MIKSSTHRKKIKEQFYMLPLIVPQLQLANLLSFLQIGLLQTHFVDKCVDVLSTRHNK